MRARETASTYRDIFGEGNFFLEIQDQGLALEKQIRPDLLRLEKELSIPLVATNDSHYLCGDDSYAHEVLLCVQTASSIHDEKRAGGKLTNPLEDRSRSRKQQLELLSLRGRVAQLSRELRERAGSEASRETGQSTAAETNAADSILFSASATNRVPAGNAIVLGGWSYHYAATWC